VPSSLCSVYNDTVSTAGVVRDPDAKTMTINGWQLRIWTNAVVACHTPGDTGENRNTELNYLVTQRISERGQSESNYT
jgi:hypothetical protein